jgi:prepilin-type N-terminal cleavage/methylation domain-containing protein
MQNLRRHFRTAPSNSPARLRAFTLLELLTVMAIISVLLVAVRPAVSSLSMSGSFTNSMNQVAQAFDLARQRAISKNTYVWVAFHEGVDNKVPYLDVCVVESKTGTDTLAWNGSATLPSDPNFTLVQRTARIPQLDLVPAGQVTEAQIPSLPSLNESPSDMAKTVSFRFDAAKSAWSGADFDHVVEFTPSGEARISKGLVGYIEVGLKHWPKSTPAVIRLSGITGLSTVYH